jgi:hypothetical protein
VKSLYTIMVYNSSMEEPVAESAIAKSWADRYPRDFCDRIMIQLSVKPLVMVHMVGGSNAARTFTPHQTNQRNINFLKVGAALAFDASRGRPRTSLTARPCAPRDAAMTKNTINPAIGFDRFQTMSLMMAQFLKGSDAWRDFVADCEKRVTPIASSDRNILAVPDDVWAYWTSVARGNCDDYDSDGARAGPP